jgi:NEDD4-binding protein 2
MVNGKYVFQPDKLREYHIKNQADCEVYMAAGIERIIIDNTNTMLREMDPYLRLAERYDYEVYIHEPDTPWAKDVDECAKRNTHDVPKEAIERMQARWEHTINLVPRIITDYKISKVMWKVPALFLCKRK